MHQATRHIVPRPFKHLRPLVFQPAVMMRWLTVLSLGVTLGMLGLGAAILFDLRADAWRNSERAADNLILALSQDIARNITVYDLSIQGMIKALGQPALAQADPAIRRMALFDTAATAEYLASMLIANAQGDVIENSEAPVFSPDNIAYREHFSVHMDRRDVGLFISRPVDGGIVHDKLMVLTRRITNPDGSFGGVALGAMRIAYFRDLFEKLDVGKKGTVGLVRDDGRIMMRRPFSPDLIDQDMHASMTFRTFLTAPHGHFVAISALDGVQRLFTFHKIEHLPLYLSIAVAVEDIYAEWWRKTISVGAILTILCVSAVVLCLLFRREIKRRMVAEDSLRQAARDLSVMAATDGLTGIANRRAFDDVLAQEWRRAVRVEAPLAILLLDVDCFKLFNDHYGHQSGDKALQAIAICISAHIRRPADVVARYGGEEFIVLLPEADLSGALIVAETIRSEVAALDIPHAPSAIGSVTTSVGAAFTYPTRNSQSSALVKAADDALYQAKRSGRNRVSSDGNLGTPVVAIESLTLTGVY